MRVPRHTLTRSDLADSPLVATGARERNPYRQTQEIWLYARLLLYVVLDVLAIFIALAIMKKIRSRRG